MLNDGSNTASTTSAPTPNVSITPDVKEQIKKLKYLQQKLWAILGLKMACDRLRSLGYDVVVQQENMCATIKVDLKIDFNFDSGQVGGKDVVAIETELKRQIETLEGKSEDSPKGKKNGSA